MPNPLLELAAKLEAASGVDRELDAEITIALYGWKLCPIGPDARGENASEVLTPDGKPMGGGFTYPPLGKIHRAYHCPAWSRDCKDEAFPKDAVRRQSAEMLRARAKSLPSAEGAPPTSTPEIQ